MAGLRVLSRILIVFSFLSLGKSETCELSNGSNLPWTNFLIPSSFPGVPPYIHFTASSKCPQRLPKILKQELLWGKTLRGSDKENTDFVIRNSGFGLVDRFKSKKQIFQSFDRYPSRNWKEDKKIPDYKSEAEKLNYLPNVLELDNKANLSKNLKKMIERHGEAEYPFVIPTYTLPEEYDKFQAKCQSLKDKIWVQKPKFSARSGIRFWKGCSSIKNRTSVVQKYFRNPLTFKGKNMEFRKYVFITGFDPFRIFVFPNELLKISATNYTKAMKKLGDPCVHRPWALTCKSLEAKAHYYYRGITTDSPDFGEIGVDIKSKRAELNDAVIKVMLSAQKSIADASYAKLKSRYNSFGLLAFDFFVDTENRLWLNEVNRRPSQGTTAGRNVRNIISGALTLAGFHLPNTLSAEAKEYILKSFKGNYEISDPTFNSSLYKLEVGQEDIEKQQKYAGTENGKVKAAEILDGLTQAEMRHLMIAEDELNRVPEGVERIFPSSNMGKYLNFIETKPYNTVLFTEWEKKYGSDRKEGVKKLRSLIR